jgi:hypothetical protein
MTATILQFPVKEISRTSYRIPLYSDEEVFITLLIVNTFGDLPFKAKEEDLARLDSSLVLKYLHDAQDLSIFSASTRSLIRKILRSVEEIPIQM